MPLATEAAKASVDNPKAMMNICSKARLVCSKLMQHEMLK